MLNAARNFFFSIACLFAPLTAFAHGISDADKKAMLDGGYLQYVFLGAKHMLTGYDHLLFIFGVIFFLTKYKDIVKFITVFTLGHSITLIFATIFKINANYFIIDAVIALSVCYKGFDNIDGFKNYLGIKAPNLLKMVFIFGLIHGFGLSTRLQQLPLGDDMVGLVARIISFNVGVELGQIIALSIICFAMANWRKKPMFARFSIIANHGLIVGGLLLFLMQLHGLVHTVNPEEFGFAEDNHAHSHESLIKAQKEIDEKAKANFGENILK